MSEFKDFAVSGEYVEGLPAAERWFELIEEPYYKTEEFDKEKNEEQLVFPVKLSNGTIGKYYPNKTSARKVATLTKTTDMAQWKGKKFYWGNIMKQQAFGKLQTVIYITDFYPAMEKVK